jgi:hypothetical protein
MSSQSVIHFSAIFFTALALAPSFAHVMELPNKIHMPRESYLTVQRIYRGWSLLGFVVIGAFISTLLLLTRAEAAAFVPALIAFSCIAAAQAVFWALTFPVNRRTSNWTQATTDWERLRRRWEYSHPSRLH